MGMAYDRGMGWSLVILVPLGFLLISAVIYALIPNSLKR